VLLEQVAEQNLQEGLHRLGLVGSSGSLTLVSTVLSLPVPPVGVVALCPLPSVLLNNSLLAIVSDLGAIFAQAGVPSHDEWIHTCVVVGHRGILWVVRVVYYYNLAHGQHDLLVSLSCHLTILPALVVKVVNDVDDVFTAALCILLEWASFVLTLLILTWSLISKIIELNLGLSLLESNILLCWLLKGLRMVMRWKGLLLLAKSVGIDDVSP